VEGASICADDGPAERHGGGRDDQIVSAPGPTGSPNGKKQGRTLDGNGP
jgi:hypothetical protein